MNTNVNKVDMMDDMKTVKLNQDSYLALLKERLTKVTGSWTVEDYHSFISFYSSIIPSLMDVERSTVFIMELGSKRICSIYGTGLETKQIQPPVDGSTDEQDR